MANEISLELREKVKNFALEAVKEADDEIELVDVAFFKQYGKLTVEALLWKKSGIDLNDCEKVHRAIDEPLDDLNPTGDTPYILSVSSPGLDRPVKNQYDFIRNKGKDVEVKLYKKLDGKKSFVGKLTGFDDDEVKIEILGQEKTFKKDMVAAVCPVIEF